MPKADTANWTPLDHVCDGLLELINTKDSLQSQMYKVQTVNGQTKFNIAKVDQ